MKLGITGHRTSDIGGFSLPNPTYITLCKEFEKQLKTLRPEIVYTGMAHGNDQWIAHICNKLHIPYVACVPFKGQENNWPSSTQRIYHSLLDKAKEVVIVSEGGYSPAKMMIRNEYIVDNTNVLMACLRSSKTSGGTFNCVEYARSKHRPIVHIDPDILCP